MTILTTTLSDDAREFFPYDLSAWMDHQELMGLALRTAAEVGASHFGTDDFIRDGTRYRPQMLLALLSYSYATGRFASSLIEQAIREDETTRYLTANTVLDRDLLRLFRRRHRAALKESLLRLMRNAWETRQLLMAVPMPVNATSAASPNARPPSARFMRDLVCEVERRVDRAVQSDAMEMDE